MIEIVIPKAASEIIETLQTHGYEAYIVGGCVRDSLLGRIPGDWDITTSALPSEVKSLFRRTIDTGIQHGTVTVMVGKEGYEVTTYRIDGDYEDGRHPKEVTFTPNLAEDLKRRDFTINAMAYNEKDGLIDLFGGQEDLKRGRICCVGSPKERFNEDALRMMRAIRFAAQLGFTIEEETFFAIKKLADHLSKISVERIHTELNKLLVSNHPELFELFYDSRITSIILPEFDTCVGVLQNSRYHKYTVDKHIMKVVESVPPILHLRLAALFHDIGKPKARTTDEFGFDHFKRHMIYSEEMAKDILKRLKYDNETTKKVLCLIRWHDYFLEPDKIMIRKVVNKVGTDLFPDLLLLMRADAKGKNEVYSQKDLDKLDKVKAVYEEILEDNDCLTLKDLQINGDDLIKAGIKPGKEIGEILNRLLQEVLENPKLNIKEELLKRI
ncbi:tRNA nucleotidyltransferase [Lachnospiraceae bacterium TWA4]|nr:tRNA nucleotidyltransferase [Lachnospiraceae bacterium TWA4]